MNSTGSMPTSMNFNNFQTIPTISLVRLRTTKKFCVYDMITLQEAGIDVLTCNHLKMKCVLSYVYCNLWKRRQIFHLSNILNPISFPMQPCRAFPNGCANENNDFDYERKELLLKMLKKNSIEYTIHGIANAELYAIDLFWDLIVRFMNTTKDLPLDFFDDMIFIVNQEVNHFLSWYERLDAYNIRFGDFPLYHGLWTSALETSDNLLARLAIINLTHEAKGLDTYILTREKMLKQNDLECIRILDMNCQEEIFHVKAGLKWFKFLCEKLGYSPLDEYHKLSRQYFKGCLKPPFNVQARNQAGLSEQWYIPLTKLR